MLLETLLAQNFRGIESRSQTIKDSLLLQSRWTPLWKKSHEVYWGTKKKKKGKQSLSDNEKAKEISLQGNFSKAF